MNLEIEVRTNAQIITNVRAVADECLAGLKKYEGCVATPETLKSDKKACANINALKKFIASERINFDRAVENQPDVKAVHDALREVETRCDEVRAPYWASVKAIEDADKPAEETFTIRFTTRNLTLAAFAKFKKSMEKAGIEYAVDSMDVNK